MTVIQGDTGDDAGQDPGDRDSARVRPCLVPDPFDSK
jgi:hypothetical protein